MYFFDFLQWDRQVFFNLSCHLFSYPFCLKTNFLFHRKSFFFFLQKIRRGEKKSSVSCFKSLQVKTNFWATFCRPIKGSQLTPNVQVRLICFYLLIFMSFFSSKFHVCKVLSVNTFLCVMVLLVFFHYVCFESLCIFPVLKNVIETGVRCLYLQSVLYLWQWLSIHNFLCRAAPNICGNHLR